MKGRFKICFAIALGVFCTTGNAQTPGGERPIDVVGERGRGVDRPEPGGGRGDRDSGSRGRSSRGNSSSSPTTAPITYLPYDTGTPPLPPPGYVTHKVEYSDGSYDVVSVRGGNYDIERYTSNGRRAGGERGSVAGYPGASNSPMWLQPPPVWTCYTPIGPIRVNNPMMAGQPCYAIVPSGRFFGTAGGP